MEGQTLGNTLCGLFALPVRYINDDRVLCAFESLLQIQTNFNGIFVNLKLITEDQEARAVTKTVKFKREIEHSATKIVNYFKTRLDQSSSQNA